MIKTVGDTRSAVFEYENPELADIVVSGMNKLDIAGSKLSVQRIPQSSASLLLKAPTTTAAVLSSPSSEPSKSKVIKLSNMVTATDLEDDEMYQELLEDVADECNKHAKVIKVVVPRGVKGQGLDPDIGKIFVLFDNVDGAEKALKAVAGRRFNGTTVGAEFFAEEVFHEKVSGK